ncbi:MAG TPA: lysylphosphatidylglycerol synthase transmembrane domain-containing protein [Tepidisphaeraceae bacterium]|nr:lysylphosphatidylglycerol synthase transmembrane domain-containing protein [Tepidisphaeraceae bacterium]
MHPRAKSLLKTSVRWGIAVLGVWFVVRNISLHDRVLVTDPATGRPVAVRLLEPADESARSFVVQDPNAPAGARLVVPREQLVVKPELDQVDVRLPGSEAPRRMDVLGLEVSDAGRRDQWPLVVTEPRNLVMKFLGRYHADRPVVVPPGHVAGAYQVTLEYPLIERGLVTVVRRADATFLLLAVAVMGFNYILPPIRWRRLMQPLDIHLSLGRAFSLNMVGAFYNTFMPGSTGGDLLKAYYASKQTPHRTRAVMSVLIDRVIGLMALVLLGGSMAAWQASRPHPPGDPVAERCLQVAVGSAAIIAAFCVGLVVFYVPPVRRYSGFDFVLRRLPMQKQVMNAVQALEMYGRRPWAIVEAILISLPVHATTVVSASLAGRAFNLPLTPDYYWVVVPVVTLAGALPVSPQGAGVMEFFAYILMRRQGATVGQAVLLTLSIRLTAIFWNLLGGLVVLRGGFHAPTDTEQRELDQDVPPPARGSAAQMPT